MNNQNEIPIRNIADPLLANHIAEGRKKREAAERRHESAKKKLTIEVGADYYGMLVAAGLVNDCTPEEAAETLIALSVCGWQEANFREDWNAE